MALDTVRCGNCGTDNPKDADFCQECGKPLTQSAGEGVREQIAAQDQGGVFGNDPGRLTTRDEDEDLPPRD
jgi:predicted amidophosphoribosyltransferase